MNGNSGVVRCVLGLCFCWGTLVAQTATVTVPAVVRDHDGNAVADFSKEDFQLFDKGKPVGIASFTVVKPEPGSPHSTAWVFDDIQIGDLGAFTRLRAAAVRQVDSTQAGDRIGIFTTSCRVSLDFTDSRGKLQEALARLEFQPVPTCNPSDAQVPQFAILNSLAHRMAAISAQRSIILMSPGFSVGGSGARDEGELIDSAIRSRTAIHSLDLAATNPTVLTELAHGTGGVYAASGKDVDAAFRKLAPAESYYLLSIVQGTVEDGSFHPLRVKLKDPRQFEVQARAGYFARKAPGSPEPAQASSGPSRELLADAIENSGPAAKPQLLVAASAEAARIVPTGTVILPPTLSGEPAGTAEITSHDEPLTFQEETNLVLVPVVVRDAEGHAVRNLRKEDFQLADKGRKQQIARFAIEKTAPASRSTHFIAYLFDDIHLTSEDIGRVRNAARRQIAALSPGDRVGIFTTSGLNAPMDFIGDHAKAAAALLELRPNAIEAGELGSRLSLAVIRDLVRRMAALSGRRSIVLVSPGFDLADTLLADRTNLLDRAIHSSIVIGAVDTRNANSEFLAAMAEGSGGTFVGNSADFDAGFKRVTAFPECVYIVGFAPEKLKADGSLHDLKVTVRGSGTFALQARRGYYAPKRGGNAAETSKQEIETAVFSRDEMHDVPVDVTTHFLRSGDLARLTVEAAMNIKQVHFRKTEGRNRDDVTVVSSLFNSDGDFLAGAQKVVQFQLRDETRKKLELGAPIMIRTVFNLKPGNYLVRLVVRDAEGQQMTARSSPVEIR